MIVGGGLPTLTAAFATRTAQERIEGRASARPAALARSAIAPYARRRIALPQFKFFPVILMPLITIKKSASQSADVAEVPHVYLECAEGIQAASALVAPLTGDISALSDSTDKIDWLWSQIEQRLGQLRPFLERTQLSLSAGVLARQLNLKDSRVLKGLLVQRGLPPFDRLRDPYYVVRLLQMDARKISLCTFSLRQGKDSSEYYRMVRRTTGLQWTIVQQRGVSWAKAFAIVQWHRGF